MSSIDMGSIDMEGKQSAQAALVGGWMVAGWRPRQRTGRRPDV
jgi:hypothetical protein